MSTNEESTRQLSSSPPTPLPASLSFSFPTPPHRRMPRTPRTPFAQVAATFVYQVFASPPWQVGGEQIPCRGRETNHASHRVVTAEAHLEPGYKSPCGPWRWRWTARAHRWGGTYEPPAGWRQV